MTITLTDVLLLTLSAFGAGVMNAVAGGGTLLTFPALLSVVSPVVANATSTVALVPGSAASAWGYRNELRACRRWLLLLLGPSLAGGALGALLVTRLDERVFRAAVPWLILVAAILFLVQPLVARAFPPAGDAPARAALVGIVVFQFFVAAYGGYFGAGIGILMLASLGLMGVGDVHRMNALKTVLAFCINGISVVVFVLEGDVAWPYALLMVPAAILGGYAGARGALRLHPGLVRAVVALIAFALAAHFFYNS
jgi:uncharacterized membrane protein YfcA